MSSYPTAPFACLEISGGAELYGDIPRVGRREVAEDVEVDRELVRPHISLYYPLACC